MHLRILGAAAVLAGLVVPAGAQAHVTLQPDSAPAGTFTVLNVRVPNEQDNAATTKVDLKLPDGFVFASYQAVPGWTAKVTKTKLATPVKTDDGEVTEQISQITWTADSPADGVQPGQFRDFPLSVQIPDKPGTALTFKAVQTYSNGDVVRWIGPEGSAEPAPQVQVTAAPAQGMHHASAADAESGDHGKHEDGDYASKGLTIAALVLGALGTILGGVALARRR